MQGTHCMRVVAMLGTMMEWHFQHLTETMTGAVATVLRYTPLDGGTTNVNVQI